MEFLQEYSTACNCWEIIAAPLLQQLRDFFVAPYLTSRVAYLLTLVSLYLFGCLVSCGQLQKFSKCQISKIPIQNVFQGIWNLFDFAPHPHPSAWYIFRPPSSLYLAISRFISLLFLSLHLPTCSKVTESDGARHNAAVHSCQMFSTDIFFVTIPLQLWRHWKLRPHNRVSCSTAELQTFPVFYLPTLCGKHVSTHQYLSVAVHRW